MHPKKQKERTTQPPDKVEIQPKKKLFVDELHYTSGSQDNQNYFKSHNKLRKTPQKQATSRRGTKDKISKDKSDHEMRKDISSKGPPQKNHQKSRKIQNQPKHRQKGFFERLCGFCDCFRKKQKFGSPQKQEKSFRSKNKNKSKIRGQKYLEQKEITNQEQKSIQNSRIRPAFDWDNSTINIDITETQLIEKPIPLKRLQQQFQTQFKENPLESPTHQKSRPYSGGATKRHQRSGLPNPLANRQRFQSPDFPKKIERNDHQIDYFGGEYLNKKYSQQINQLNDRPVLKKHKASLEQSPQRKNNFESQKLQCSENNAQKIKSIKKKVKIIETQALRQTQQRQYKSKAKSIPKLDDSLVSFDVLGPVLQSKIMKDQSPQKIAQIDINNSAEKQCLDAQSSQHKKLTYTSAQSFNSQHKSKQNESGKIDIRQTQSEIKSSEGNDFDEQSVRNSQISGISFIKPKFNKIQFNEAKKFEDEQLLMDLSGIALQSGRFSPGKQMNRTVFRSSKRIPKKDFVQPPQVCALQKSAKKRQSLDLKKTKGIGKAKQAQEKQSVPKRCTCNLDGCKTQHCTCRKFKQKCTQLCNCVSKNCTNRAHRCKVQNNPNDLSQIISRKSEEDKDFDDIDQPGFQPPKFVFGEEKKQMQMEIQQQERREDLVEEVSEMVENNNSMRMISSGNEQSYHSSDRKSRSESDGGSRFRNLVQQELPMSLISNTQTNSLNKDQKQ